MLENVGLSIYKIREEIKREKSYISEGVDDMKETFADLEKNMVMILVMTFMDIYVI